MSGRPGDRPRGSAAVRLRRGRDRRGEDREAFGRTGRRDAPGADRRDGDAGPLLGALPYRLAARARRQDGLLVRRAHGGARAPECGGRIPGRSDAQEQRLLGPRMAEGVSMSRARASGRRNGRVIGVSAGSAWRPPPGCEEGTNISESGLTRSESNAMPLRHGARSTPWCAAPKRRLHGTECLPAHGRRPRVFRLHADRHAVLKRPQWRSSLSITAQAVTGMPPMLDSEQVTRASPASTLL